MRDDFPIEVRIFPSMPRSQSILSNGAGLKRNPAPSRTDGLFYETIKYSYQFGVLKKWCNRLCWGPGARTERAGSIGRVSSWPRRQKLVSSGGGGGIFPAPSPKKSAPYDSKRAGLAPGPWKHLTLTTLLFSKK